MPSWLSVLYTELRTGLSGRAHQSCFAVGKALPLCQFNKAIGLLQCHLEARDTTSLRIALFTCVTFIYLELFRGHYQIARSLLDHGIKMLNEIKASSSSDGIDGSPIDRWTFRTLRRLYFQFTVFGLPPQQPWNFCYVPKPQFFTTIFLSVHEARGILENILLRLCQATNSPLLFSEYSAEVGVIQLVSRQTKDDLKSWMSAYDTAFALSGATMDKAEAFAFSILRIYHTMAEIIAETLCEIGESKYDHQTPSFLLLLQQILDIHKVASNHKIRDKYFGPEDGADTFDWRHRTNTTALLPRNKMSNTANESPCDQAYRGNTTQGGRLGLHHPCNHCKEDVRPGRG